MNQAVFGCLRRWRQTSDQVKRELGANPKRSRHCDKGVRLHNVTEAFGLWEDEGVR